MQLSNKSETVYLQKVGLWVTVATECISRQKHGENAIVAKLGVGFDAILQIPGRPWDSNTLLKEIWRRVRVFLAPAGA